MKLIGAVTVFTACAMAGFMFSNRLRKRSVYLRNILTALNLLETEISFGGNRLKQAFLKIDSMSDTLGLFTAAAERIEEMGIKRAWKSAVEEKVGELRLTDVDAEILISLGAQLGMTDTQNQIKNTRYVKGRLETQIAEAENEYKNMGRLWRNGGILTGLFLILILI